MERVSQEDALKLTYVPRCTEAPASNAISGISWRRAKQVFIDFPSAATCHLQHASGTQLAVNNEA